MPETLKDVLPPAPHEIVKEFADEVKKGIDALRTDAKAAVDDLAPHKVLGEFKPSELKPPAPPKPPKPPRLGE